MGDVQTHVVVVLPASPGINVQSGNSRVEVTRFEARAPTVPHPHIQPSSELDDAGVGAAGPGVRHVVRENRGLPEASIAAAYANPWGNGVAGKKFKRTDGVTNRAPMSLGVVPSKV